MNEIAEILERLVQMELTYKQANDAIHALIASEPHLCSTCRNNFPTCKGKKIVWGIDRNPTAKGTEADKVFECDAYIADVEPAEPQAEMMPLIKNPYLDAVMNSVRTTFEQTQFAQIIQAMIKKQRDADMAWLPARDQQVAAKAVKEFADKVMRDLPDFRGREKFCNHIRAMAGKE